MTQRILSAPKHGTTLARALLGAAALAAAMACSRGGEETSLDTAAGAVTDSASADTAGAAMSPAAADSAAKADSARRTPADTSAVTRRTPTAAAATARSTSGTRASSASTGATGAARSSRTGTSAGTPRTAAVPTPPAAASSATAATSSVAATPPPAAPADTSPKRDLLAAAPAAYEGWKTFHVYCYRCHGVDAVGGQLAPDLRNSVGPQGSATHDAFIQTVANGRLEKGMPAWKELLSAEQMENLYAYVKARQEGQLAAGRPHRAGQ